jgi:nucleoside-diphosphate-sugar epimerase
LKVLITGGNGFLGRIIKKTIINNCEAFTLGRNNSHYCVDLSLNDRIEFTEKFNLVIHCAGKAHQVPKSHEEVDELYRVNVRGTANLLKALEKPSPPKTFIFTSTVAVYGLNQGNLIIEDAPILATDPYGLSKIQAEQLVQEWCKKNGVICTILRLPLIAGPNSTGNLGAMIRGIQKGYYFNIDGGKAKKSMVLAEDVAKFMLKVAEVGGIFNLTDGYHPNFNELSNLIAEQLGKNKPYHLPLTFARLAAKIGDIFGSKAPINSDKLQKITSNLTFDDSKARAAFGWDPTPVLEGFKINE